MRCIYDCIAHIKHVYGKYLLLPTENLLDANEKICVVVLKVCIDTEYLASVETVHSDLECQSSFLIQGIG